MKNVTHKLLSAMLVSSLALQACGQQSKRQEAHETVQDFTADEVFDGILFKYGRVAQAIPEFRNTYSFESTFKTDEEKKSALELISFIKDKLAAKNPNYLNEFKSAMESGDHLAVSQQIEHIGNEINSILDANRAELEKSGKGMCVAVVAALVSAVVAQTALAANSVAAVSIAVVRYLALWAGGGCAKQLPKTPGACLSDDLMFEQAIDSIVRTLEKSKA